MSRRDVDVDALADALRAAEGDGPSWGRRLARRALVKAAGPGLFAAAAGAGLKAIGVDLATAYTVTMYASPFVLVGVASFVVHAWRQNFVTLLERPSDVDVAEPGCLPCEEQEDVANEPAHDLATPTGHAAPQATVTVTVTDLPRPPAELPHAGHTPAPTYLPETEAIPHEHPA